MSSIAVARARRSPIRTSGVPTQALLQLIKLLVAVAVLAIASIAAPARAQGCSQCSESVGQTPARTQSAYRKGILLMVIAGGGVFASVVIVLRRFR